ncbi:hypothetical protein PGT21_021823 [Puccinia graminis f. sp. tritici]|nr:hypothetical protein PGT21_021823 [Puccinia graminis f. sp. tritici]KAA1090378.1 hypothetical protein PGTUg99_004345 [Puccinia graminis f. sp. tritici]
MRSNYLLKSSNYLIKRSLNDGESSSICTICQEPLPKNPWGWPDCNHPFHTDCARRWVHNKRDPPCPICKRPGGDLESKLNINETEKSVAQLKVGNNTKIYRFM